MKISDLKKYIRDIPDFPKEGIIFKDISTLLKNPEAFQKSIDTLAKAFKKARVCICRRGRGARVYFRGGVSLQIKSRICPGAQKRQTSL